MPVKWALQSNLQQEVFCLPSPTTTSCGELGVNQTQQAPGPPSRMLPPNLSVCLSHLHKLEGKVPVSTVPPRLGMEGKQPVPPPSPASPAPSRCPQRPTRTMSSLPPLPGWGGGNNRIRSNHHQSVECQARLPGWGKGECAPPAVGLPLPQPPHEPPTAPPPPSLGLLGECWEGGRVPGGLPAGRSHAASLTSP